MPRDADGRQLAHYLDLSTLDTHTAKKKIHKIPHGFKTWKEYGEFKKKEKRARQVHDILEDKYPVEYLERTRHKWVLCSTNTRCLRLDVLESTLNYVYCVVQNGAKVTGFLVHVQVHVHVTQRILALLHLGSQRTTLVPLRVLDLLFTKPHMSTSTSFITVLCCSRLFRIA